ncbi:MAG: sterol desaturase family protein [Crocinitomicaceae bacterium]|nr:sterol desaturase family protein [Crocinitomicaceae bacterium]
MEKYIEIITNSFIGYYNYLVESLLHPSFQEGKLYTLYFYFLIILSLLVWSLEIILPWRKKQPVFRKGFWQDAFYMFFNFFLFGLIGFAAISEVGVNLWKDFFALFGIENMVAIKLDKLPIWIQFGILFILYDLIQWTVHVLLHRIPWMWKFHKVHHSVTEMGFAAHLRFHWMESVFYKSALFIILSFIGFGLDDLFFMHIFNITIGHLNHANINMDYGLLKYILNNPRMHIWHHAKEMPREHPYGMNFGITLSIWDYLFGKAYIPNSGRDIDLGFEHIEDYPETIGGQMIQPFKKEEN